MDARPVGLDQTPVALLRAGIGNSLASSAVSVSSSGGGQLRPAAWKRLIVARTVDAATPI